MKKNILLIKLAIFCSFVTIQAQVGINTEDPKATFHVSTSNNLVPDGIIAPNLTLVQLKSRDTLYGDSQKGTSVYVTDVSGTTIVETKNITAVVYYYFDGDT